MDMPIRPVGCWTRHWSLPVQICHPYDNVFVAPAADAMTHHTQCCQVPWTSFPVCRPINLQRLTQGSSGRRRLRSF